MNTTIAVIASARRNGNTGRLIDWIADELKIEVIDLTDKNISPFDYQHRNIDDDFLPLMDCFLTHDNIIFASPVYWFAMSAPMKIFIDRMSDFLEVEELKGQGRKLRGKVGYIVSTSISEKIDDSLLDSFVNTFEYLGMGYGGYIHADCKHDFNSANYQSDVIKFVEQIKYSGVNSD